MIRKIKKSILIFLCILLVLPVLIIGTAAKEAEVISFQASAEQNEKILIKLDGKQIIKDRAILLNGVTYVPLRAFCDAIDVEVTWDAKTRTAIMTKGKTVATATDKDVYIFSEGRCYYAVTPIRILSDNTMYVPIRPISQAFGITVSWEASTRSVSLQNTGILPKNGDSFYHADDLYWLSRIISAEARGESLEGQIAVGNVVLNRKRSTQYPNTVYGVIFDRKHGVQFSPILNGSIYQKPTASSIIAAKICLEGYTVSDQILFFMNPDIATNHWISHNRPFAFRIGNHSFYY